MTKFPVVAAALLAGVAAPAFALDEIETRAYYSTNADNAVGKYVSAPMTKISDWTDDYMIATCGANDMCTAFKGSHENNVLDTYALYAAWDDKNLYIAWQMCNTGDTWAREGDGPLTDYGHIGEVPLILAISVDPSSTCMSGKLENGDFIWQTTSSNGVTFKSHVDHLFFMSGKVGTGVPAMFTASNASGATNYGANCKEYTKLGISYYVTNDFAPSHYWRQKETANYDISGTLISDPSILESIYDKDCYENLLGPNYPSNIKPHSTEYDSFFQITIPMSALGIDREWLEANGIGARIVATRGESGIDCIPFDPAMVDNVFDSYGADKSTSHEKDDIDEITYALANIGKMRTGSVTPPPGPVDPDPVDPDDPDDPTPPADGNYVIYYDNASTNWGTVYTWIWDEADGDKNYTGGAWPGAVMTLDNTNGYYRYSFNCEAASPKLRCMFNPGGDNGKTKEFDLVNHGLYNNAGFVRSLDATGVDSVVAAPSADTEYFNLQGHRVSASSLTPGIYIVKTGSDVRKTVIR